jgi:glycosyltransferase involved in cell wall biosynthesis
MSTLGVASQTPLVQFMNPALAQSPMVELSSLKENVDYRLSPGGVSRMLFPFLTSIRRKGIIGAAEWVALNPQAPKMASAEGITLHHLAMPPEKMAGYGSVKEEIWRLFHTLGPHVKGPDFWQDEYMDYTYLNRLYSEKMEELSRQIDFDGFYIHDFQLLPLGSMLHSPRPKIFRWHIPLVKEEVPKSLQGALVRYLSSYDAVVVSTKSYLKNLKAIGYKGTAYCLYPYIDPSGYSQPRPEDIASLRARFGLKEGDRLVLNVGRMDPMKSQHSLILALKRVLKKVPNAKLLLVGNGSFSSSKQGMGGSKAERWRTYLKNLATSEGVSDRVIFAGYLAEGDLRTAYSACDVFVLPSVREGFGLVVVEAWLFRKPTIVSSRAGISDIITDGINGLTFHPGNEGDLAWKIVSVLKDPEFARQLGRAGYRRSKACHLETGIKNETEILTRFVGGIGDGTN